MGWPLPWTPGALCSTERCACSSWWPQVAGDLVSPSFVFTTAADLVGSGPPLDFGPRVSVRPDSPLKPFSGRVLGRDEVIVRALDHGFDHGDEQLPVVVAPAVTVSDEMALRRRRRVGRRRQRQHP